MDLNLVAVIVGIVEGLTEYIPVSSTGHMIIVGHMLGFEGDLANVFDVFVQLGAILSVIVIYRKRFEYFFNKEGWQLKADKMGVWHVAAGIVPTMLFAFLVHSAIKKYLFSPFTVAIGLFFGALLMIVAERYTDNKEEFLVQDVDKISIRQAFMIGFFQFLSLWPGFSRSGSTIAGGLFVGVSRKTAADYTFIIAVPLMFVACIYDLLKNLSFLHGSDFTVLAIGFVVSGVVAYMSILWFLKFLNKSRLTSFAIYRILLSLLTLYYFYG